MTPHSESFILIYCFIGCIVGVGLFFSRSMDNDAYHYFSAGMTKGGGMIVFSIFLLTLLNALIILLPSLTFLSSNIVVALIVSTAVILPLLFGKQTMVFMHNLTQIGSKTTNVVINILGLVFFCSIQIIVLVQITDLIIVQFFGSSQYSLLVIMIVAAGIYTMVGGLNAVLYSNIILGTMTLVSIIFIFFNTLFLNNQLFFSFKDTMQFGAEIFRASGITESNLVVTVIGVMLIMMWLIWVEIGEADRTVSAGTQELFVRKLFGVGMLLLVTISGILYVASVQPIIGTASVFGITDSTNYFIIVSFLGGLMGVFAISFQLVGSIAALRVYPYFKKNVGDEEQILIGRLSIVIVVLLSIILISFSKVTGYRTFIWYVNFSAFFFTPIVAALLSAVLAKKGGAVGFLFGVIAGEGYAVMILIGQQFEMYSSLLQSRSAYAFSIDIAVVTLFVGIISAKVSELLIVQKMLSRVKITRSTTV